MAQSTKICPVCQTEFPPNKPFQIYCGPRCNNKVSYQNDLKRMQANPELKEKRKKYYKGYYEANKATIIPSLRNTRMRRVYGITIAERDAMVAAQGYECAICKTDLRVTEPMVDHIKGTKTVRGILCHHCNVGLGHFDDNIEWIQAAIEYLKKFKE